MSIPFERDHMLLKASSYKRWKWNMSFEILLFLPYFDKNLSSFRLIYTFFLQLHCLFIADIESIFLHQYFFFKRTDSEGRVVLWLAFSIFSGYNINQKFRLFICFWSLTFSVFWNDTKAPCFCLLINLFKFLQKNRLFKSENFSLLP